MLPVKLARLALPDPAPDQASRDVVALRQAVQHLACQEFLDDLTPELDAVRSVLCHGFQSPKARPTGQLSSPELSALRGPLQSGA